MSKAIEHLRNHQTQLDADGVMVAVSRQALDEVMARVEELEEAGRALINRFYKADGDAAYDNLAKLLEPPQEESSDE